MASSRELPRAPRLNPVVIGHDIARDQVKATMNYKNLEMWHKLLKDKPNNGKVVEVSELLFRYVLSWARTESGLLDASTSSASAPSASGSGP